VTAEERAEKWFDPSRAGYERLVEDFRAAQADTAREVFDLCEGLPDDERAKWDKRAWAFVPSAYNLPITACDGIAAAIAKAREAYLER
jgi:hypothetical protein